MKLLSTITLVALGLSAGVATASPSSLTALVCKGTYGKTPRTWSLTATVISGAPLINGRAFAEILVRPNFPSGVRIAPEGFYLLKHTLVGTDAATVYTDPSGTVFQLRVPAAQPPGPLPSKLVAFVTLRGATKLTVTCDVNGNADESEE